MKRRLTLRASCKEPNSGISLLTVSLPGRRQRSDAVARTAGAARPAEIKPPPRKPVPVRLGEVLETD